MDAVYYSVRNLTQASFKVVLNQPVIAMGVGGVGVMPGAVAGGRNPALIQYAIKVFGTTDLEPSQWKQCEDQLKVCQQGPYSNAYF